MTTKQLTELHARVSAEVHEKAAIDIADIQAGIDDKIETELVELLELADEINADEPALKRVQKVMRK
jgi:hypothetical protein